MLFVDLQNLMILIKHLTFSSGSSELVSQKVPRIKCNMTLTKSGSVAHLAPSLDQAPQEVDTNLNAESHRGDDIQSKLKSEVNIIKLNSCTDSPVGISQISGPDKRSRPTPLSQIGFRDPASVGAGQQLTLLSVEVLITAHVWNVHIGICLFVWVRLSIH